MTLQYERHFRVDYWAAVAKAKLFFSYTFEPKRITHFRPTISLNQQLALKLQLAIGKNPRIFDFLIVTLGNKLIQQTIYLLLTVTIMTKRKKYVTFGQFFCWQQVWREILVTASKRPSLRSTIANSLLVILFKIYMLSSRAKKSTLHFFNLLWMAWGLLYYFNRRTQICG